MGSHIEKVIAELEAFQPSEDDRETQARLYEIFDNFREAPGREAAIPAILALIERHPEADMGSPGPLVHELEALPAYEVPLRESLRRQPAGLSIWMANRLVNGAKTQEQSEEWLAELRAVLEHPKASQVIREEALQFLAFQAQHG